MSFPARAELLARLALIRPEELTRLMAFRETFLARLTPERLRTDLRHLGILFGLLVKRTSFPPSAESPAAPGWPAGLRAAGDDLQASQHLLAEVAEGLLAEPSGGAHHRRARAIQGIADEIGRLADRLAALRPKRARARTAPKGPA